MKHLKASREAFEWSFFLIFTIIIQTNGQKTERRNRQFERGTVGLIFDQAQCPVGWSAVGGECCVQLQLEPKRGADAVQECAQMNAALVRVDGWRSDIARPGYGEDGMTALDELFRDVNGENVAVGVDDLSTVIEDLLQLGVTEMTWRIGEVLHHNRSVHHQAFRGVSTPKIFARKPKRRVTKLTIREINDDDAELLANFALRKRINGQAGSQFEIVEVEADSALPFICALSDAERRSMVYAEALLPKGAPRILDEQERKNHEHHYHRYNHFRQNNNHYAVFNGNGRRREVTSSYFVRLPCQAVGNPQPAVKWFRSESNEEIDVHSANSAFMISSGTLLINASSILTSSSSPSSSSGGVAPGGASGVGDVFSYYCTASNKYGIVRGPPALVRPVFMEPFADNRLDAYPLSFGGGSGDGRQRGGHGGVGTRLDCQAPRHYPKSYSYSWMYGGSTEKFVAVSERVFISMDGALYFSYNVPEDADMYACTLALPSAQSAQHGPFFRLILPQFDTTPSGRTSATSVVYAAAAANVNATARLSPPFAPLIDEYQPAVFPEGPQRGDTVHIDPLPHYKWRRADGLSLSARHRTINYGRVLRIEAVRAEDATRYTCSARNEFGTATAEVQLIIQSAPVEFRRMPDRLLAADESTTFHCNVEDFGSSGGGGGGGGPATVEWFRDSQPLVPLLMSRAERRRIHITGKELRISRVIATDAGVYQCRVANHVGAASSSALLQVGAAPPQFHAAALPQRVFVRGGAAALDVPCHYVAVPRGTAYWRRIGDDASSDTELVSEAMPTLRLRHVRPSDAGVYECVATNAFGYNRATVEIVVLGPAQIRMQTTRVDEDAGHTADDSDASFSTSSVNVLCEVELECNFADGRCPTEPLIQWSFNDRPLRTLSRGQTGDLVIEPSETRRNLTDIEMLRSKNDRHRMEADASALRFRSRLSVSDAFAHANAGRFACDATALGVRAAAEWDAPAVRGAVPAWLEARVLHSGSGGGQTAPGAACGSTDFVVQLSWQRQPNLDGSETISGYEIDVRTHDIRRGNTGDWWRRAVDFTPHNNAAGSLQSYTFCEMEPNRNYQFRVRSRDARGRQSVSSRPSNWCATPAVAPREPVAVIRYRMIDERHLLLEWDPVETLHPSAPNLGYNVSWTLDGGAEYDESDSKDETRLTNVAVVDEAHLMIVVESLWTRNRTAAAEQMDAEKCRRMMVSVRPMNDAGVSAVATDTVVYVTSEGPKRVAENVRLRRVNATHLSLAWEWRDATECENIVGVRVRCDEVRRIPVAEDYANRTINAMRNLETRNIFDIVAESAVNCSIPAHLTQWLVNGLRPSTFYRCQLTAFDHRGRAGVTVASTVASTGGPPPPTPPEITYVRLKETVGGSFAILLDWRPVPLEFGVSEESSGDDASGYNEYEVHRPTTAATEKGKKRESVTAADAEGLSGYKIFVFDSETAEHPMVVSLSADQLPDLANPSVQIDGLKTMFYYTIQIAGFNAGGLGPLSDPLPFRVGASQQPPPPHGSHSHFQLVTDSGFLHSVSPHLLTLSLILILLLRCCFYD